MNDLMSLGIHRLWKRQAVFLLNVRTQHKVLDVAGGTGDMAQYIHCKAGKDIELVVADINQDMLEVGRDRLLDETNFQPGFVCCDAEQLPFPDKHFDRIIMSFGLRNVTNKETALSSIQRVLKPGGCFVLLEFSHPAPGLKKLYDFWSFEVIPRLGQYVAGDRQSYRYLVESIRMHPNQEQTIDMLQDAGFVHCACFNLSHGIVAVHRGYRL